MLKAKAEAAEASVRAAMGCKPDKTQLLLEAQQRQQQLMAAHQQSELDHQQKQQQMQQQSDIEQQQMHLKQQQRQQRLKVMQQQIHLEQLKREEEAPIPQARLGAMSDALCWGGFDNILADGLPTLAEKVRMLLSRNATSPVPSIQSEDNIEGIPPDTRVCADPATLLEPVSFQTDPLSPAINAAAPASIENSSRSNVRVQQASSVCSV